MKNKLTKNWGLKIASFLCAAGLWLVVTNINDPVVPFRVSDVPVTIRNANLITDKGQVYEILDGTDVIDTVTISAPRSVIDTLDKSNVVAVADVNDLTSVDTIPIKLSTNKYNDKLDGIKGNIDSVRLSIEEKLTRSLPLRSATSGEVREGYMIGDVSTDQNLIRISGPKSVISQVSKAQAEVDISGFNRNINTDTDIRLYDANGKEIKAANIEKSISKVRVNVEILQIKEVPMTCVVTGAVSDGYQFTGEIGYTRSVIQVAGKSQILEHINAIEVPEGILDVAGAAENVTVSVDVHDYLPEGVVLADEEFDGLVEITAHVEQETQRAVRIPVNDIVFNGLPQDYRAVITEPENECSIMLTGLAANLDTVTEEQVTAMVDLEAWMAEEGLTELAEGSYWMPVNVFLANDTVRQRGSTEVHVHIIAEE
jgi:YbbR domain-containing protein